MEDNGANNNANSNQNAQNTTGQNNNQTSNSNVDYDKIQQMIDGRNARTEDSILKNYFQKQGLSEDEMNSAIESFKASKAQKAKEETQNSLNLQTENESLKAKLQEMEIKQLANQAALELGVDAKTIPYLVKMADLSNVVGDDGKVSSENIKTALQAVLDALPQLKPQQANINTNGFQKIGGDNNNQKQDYDDQLNKIFGISK